MHHQLRMLTTVTLGLMVLLTPATAVVLADDDNNPGKPAPAQTNPAAVDARVAGLVYHIGSVEGTTVVTLLDQDLGRAVDVYVREAALLLQIQQGTVCTNRFLSVTGVRTSPTTLDALRFEVDTTRPCGPAPV